MPVDEEQPNPPPHTRSDRLSHPKRNREARTQARAAQRPRPSDPSSQVDGTSGRRAGAT
ncbi:hypothetical protein JOF35_007109 [Streptomyces demainii]|uniref:Uncharacterized protein n=1 Tax=Streptomyces demainii TaxID=588122 RepID=A0ABT9L234_9ACTN|nr:hypothetical protein [Streptomyces demainii]